MDSNNIHGFDWDENNREKNWEMHQVSIGECEEVFFNLPLLISTDSAPSHQEPRSFILGQTNTGRSLFIAFTIRGERIRLISARDMSSKERAIYEQEDFQF